MTTTQTDADLISGSLAAPQTFAEMFERHGDRVHRYVARRAGPDLAEDLLSETFLTAFEQRARFDPTRSPGGALPWLMGIATNLLAGHRRAEARRWQILARARPDQPEPPPADRVAARVDAAAAVGALAQAIADLPDGERNALLLLAWADLTYEEIAAALSIPVGTVRSRIHRARNRLRTGLVGVPGARSLDGATDLAESIPSRVAWSATTKASTTEAATAAARTAPSNTAATTVGMTPDPSPRLYPRRKTS